MNTTDYSDTFQLSLLKDALNCGILNADSVLDTLMSTKREQVKKIHPYAITPPSSEKGRWQTFYKKADGKRKNIKAQTENELLDKLIDYKRSVSNSPNTIKRHEQHYRKYFEPSPLHNRKMVKIDELLLETECNRIIREYNLSRKEWTNIKTILNGMFEYAVRKKYLIKNPLERIQILVKFKQVVRKTGKTETYNSDELKELNLYLDRMYTETHNTAFLAIKLNFLLGLRVGELVALKWEDYSEKNHYEVVEHTKTNRDRFVVLVPKATDILKKISPESDFIFIKDGNRITSRQIAYVLEKYAERQGLSTKSSHKTRKTFASNLNFGGVPLDCIRELLGHSNLNTTLGYIYNPLTEKETFDLITKAL